jgi:hypothetical protein
VAQHVLALDLFAVLAGFLGLADHRRVGDLERLFGNGVEAQLARTRDAFGKRRLGLDPSINGLPCGHVVITANLAQWLTFSNAAADLACGLFRVCRLAPHVIPLFLIPGGMYFCAE